MSDIDGSESSAARAAITAAQAIRDGATNLGPDELEGASDKAIRDAGAIPVTAI